MTACLSLRRSLPTVVLSCLFFSGCKTSSPAITPAPTVTASVAASAPPTSLRFVDVTDTAGLVYRWVAPEHRPLNILQTIGYGCAFLDYDNDGNMDILLVGPKLALYKGDGKGRFTDVTHAAGLDTLQGDFRGCTVGDYDNDGYDDIYVSAYQGGVLLHNERGVRFTNVTKAAGIAAQPWGTSCAFVDIDGDGKMDLYIGNYLAFGPKTMPRLCPVSGVLTACGPRYYTSEHGALYRNLGNGRFSDITTTWGAQKTSGKVLGVASADYDGSGRQSLILANDEVPGDLLKNAGHAYTNIGANSGTAYDVSGNAHGGMGVDWGDYDNDGKIDVVLTTYQHEPKCIYHNDGTDLFAERSGTLGIPSSTLENVAFGVKWLDADNDGWLDLMIANGHVQDNAKAVDPTTDYRQPTQLFYNDQGQSFQDASAALIASAARSIVGRGLAIGDYDNDGKIDALVVDGEGKPLLLHNETPSSGHWLELTLAGTRSNRDGQGALVTIEAGKLTQTRQCTTNGSYLSASDRRLHVGLGAAPSAETIRVRWPSGRIDTFRNVAADRSFTLREGATAPSPPSHRSAQEEYP